MREWWREREPRERLVLSAGALALVAVLLFAFVWQPLQKRITDRRAALLEQTRTLHWMQQASQDLRALRGQGESPSGDGPQSSLLGTLETSARKMGLRERIARMEPAGDGRVQVSLRDSDFDRTIAWVAQLRSQNIEVSESTINATDSAGVVNASFTFRR